MGLTVVSQPAEWPLTLDEAKKHLRVRHNSEDDYIQSLLQAATTHLENQFELALARRQYRLTLDAFSDEIELPRRPLAAVNSIVYFNEVGDATTLDPSVYTVDTESRSPWIVRNEGQSWPATLNAINAVAITFTAGYLPAEVPDDFKQAIRMLMGHWFAQRETVVVGSISSAVPFGVKAIIDSIVVPVK